jgi:putrescine transport system ATP-binding protein
MIYGGALSKKNAEILRNVDASPYILIDNITKVVDGVTVLNGISLSIQKKELFSLLGGSGCGKTTLLRILAGLEKPTEGKVIVDGIDVTAYPPHKRQINMMFQSYALFPHMTVAQNIAFGLKQGGLSKSAINERVKDMLELVRLSGFDNRRPDQLSGGQKQRVALARSLAKMPKLLLLDEPLTALDKKLREQTQFELVNIQEEIGVTFILVTHDQEEAMTMSTRMAIINDGKVCQVGSPHDIYEFPNSKFVAKFIGSINMFDGVVIGQELDHLLIESREVDCLCYASRAGAVPIGAHVTFAIRPEKIMMSTLKPAYPRNWAQGVIKEIAYLGDISVYYVELNSGKVMIATLPNLLRLEDRNFTWEDEVYLFWRSENSLVLTL